MNITLTKIGTTQWRILNIDNNKHVDIEKVYYNHGASFEISYGDGTNKEILSRGILSFNQAKKRAMKIIE